MREDPRRFEALVARVAVQYRMTRARARAVLDTFIAEIWKELRGVDGSTPRDVRVPGLGTFRIARTRPHRIAPPPGMKGGLSKQAIEAGIALPGHWRLALRPSQGSKGVGDGPASL